MSTSTVRAGRRRAEALMLDQFRAYSPGTRTKDSDGMPTPAVGTGVDEGLTIGKLGGASRDSDPQGRGVRVGDIERRVVDASIHIPVDSPAPAAGPRGTGWEYVLTAAGPTTPAELVGSRWLVVEAPAKSFMTARRLTVVRLT
ncbi:DUF6093 family protein [Nocardioides sp.]|uniref:DUF6093 family protein n=1 Tax=Nocardioides sp. TaxID=35761 RepID=UPI003515B980